MYILYSSVLLIFSAFPTGLGDVQLTRKSKYGGISFFRVKNFSTPLGTTIAQKDVGLELSVDLLMMADYSLYQGFLEIARGDELSAQIYVQEYLTAIFDQMKVIYDKVSISNQTLHLNMTGTFIAIREADCPILTDIIVDYEDGNNTLNSTLYESFEEFNSTDMSLKIPSVTAVSKLTTWIKHFNRYLPKHDHAVLITKFDLLSPRGDSATQGMAYVGEICKAGESSSVVEDVGAAATALIAAHELGHSLGAFHDGTNNSTLNCSSSENNLMATTVSGSEREELFFNSRKMSSCSLKSIEETFSKPSSFCLKKPKMDRTQRSTALQKMMPGERFQLHQQCQISFGPHYGVCPSNDYYRGLSWCIHGECVTNKKKMMECQDLNVKTCAKYTKVKLRHFCKSQQFRDICCASCVNLKDPSIPL